MAERRILILGAGVYQAPLIRKAREMGLETVVLSTPGPHPGIDLADVFLPVDITDVEAVLRSAADENVKAVATAGTDHGLPALGALVSSRGFPGPDWESAWDGRLKSSMKEAFERAGVPHARGGVFLNVGEARVGAEALGFPVVVKPSDSSGSRGVTVVMGPEDLPAAWEAAMAVGEVPFIVEEYLEGVEFGAQAVVHGDEVVDVIIHDDVVTTQGPPTPIGHAMPDGLSDSDRSQVGEVVARAVATLGLRDCFVNVDLMMTDEGPKVLEATGRIGATGIPEMIGHHHGWDVYGHLIALALGGRPEVPAPAGRPNAVLLIRSAATGTVKSLEVPADIANHPDLLDLRWDVGPGDPVRAFRVGPDRIGHLHVRGADARAAERTAAALHDGLRIEVAP